MVRTKKKFYKAQLSEHSGQTFAHVACFQAGRTKLSRTSYKLVKPISHDVLKGDSSFFPTFVSLYIFLWTFQFWIFQDSCCNPFTFGTFSVVIILSNLAREISALPARIDSLPHAWRLKAALAELLLLNAIYSDGQVWRISDSLNFRTYWFKYYSLHKFNQIKDYRNTLPSNIYW